MKNIHLIMMGKGGVGKSTIAVLLAQALKRKMAGLRCADLDPTNATFNGYPALDAKHYDITDDDFNIDPSEFDRLMEDILTSESDWVIDTGAATFLPLMNYLIQNKLIAFLEENNRRVIIHAPLVGGPAMDETIRGLQAILKIGTASVVVWENDFFGPVEKNGKRFLQTAGYEQFKSRVLGLVHLVKRDPKQSEKDLLAMNERRLTWDEALTDPKFLIMSRQRLTVMRREIDEQIDAVEF